MRWRDLARKVERNKIYQSIFKSEESKKPRRCQEGLTIVALDSYHADT